MTEKSRKEPASYPELFQAVYGNSEGAVKNKLVDVQFLGKTVKFNSQNGAAESLTRVSERLLKIAQANTEVKKYLDRLRGPTSNLANDTFNWRAIAGSSNLSAHSYAIAIDLETGKNEPNIYWLDAEKARRKQLARVERDKELRELYADRNSKSSATGGVELRAKEINHRFNAKKKSIDTLKEKDIGPIKPEKLYAIPWQVIEAFEAEGFIWGGKWNHFDCMHFEYRPEFFPELRKGSTH